MKRSHWILTSMKHALVFLLLAQPAFSQGMGDPLTSQGIDHNTLTSAASRAMGGTTIGIRNDAGLMFSNPASLQTLTDVQLSLGGVQQFSYAQQTQQYTPLKYYSNFSLLMEGLTGYISNPDTSFHGSNAGDTVQRPFDKIGPNWSRSKTKGNPIQALLAIPFSLGETKCAVGIGAVEYANLNYYYQNNNVLSPSIGSERPIPTPLPGNDSLPVRTQWSQYIGSRDGSIRGYGVALSGAVSEKISLGISGMILNGSTDDYEQHVGRGELVFYSNYFRLDSVYSRITRTGTSDYSGQEFTFSGTYRGRYVTLGFSVKPPTPVTRKYTEQVRIDTTGSPSSTNVSGQDRLTLPWRGTLGLSIAVANNLTLGMEYELRSYASAVYRDAGGTESNPWLSSSVVHIGAEYTPLPWLAVRAGMRGQTEVFEETGNPLIGDPVDYSTYSAGCGFSFGRVRLNVTYEYALMKYQDVWQTNVNLNSESYQNVIADVTYDIPWTQ